MAAVDGNNAVRARRGETDFEHVMGEAAGVKDGAAAAFAMRVDEIADRRVDAGLPQRLDDKPALPGAIGGTRPVLQRAATADTEMRADRRGALGARLFNIEQLAAVGMAGPVFHFDNFAG